jgi:hypothetical protein
VDLERMAVRLRPRNAWEALDLGIRLVRVNFRSVYAAWLAVYVPAALLINALLLGDHPFWTWVILWWLKPAFDRVVLAVLAASLFGEPRPARAFFTAPMRAFRGTGLLAALTWRRFDLARSFHLPVHQLERIRGKPMRQRVRVLDRDARGAAVWLTFLLANVEGLFMIGLSIGVALLMPVQTPLDVLWETWVRGDFGIGPGSVAGAVLAATAVTIVEPFYVGCGFTLYLQRRTHLEGWDIELRFRQLAARLAPVAAALAVFAIGFLMPPEVQAQQTEQKLSPGASSEIKAVLADPVFGRQVPRKKLEYVGPSWGDDGRKRKSWDWGWVRKVVNFLSEAGRAITWIAGGLLIAGLLYFLARHIRLRRSGRKDAEPPQFLFGFDVRPESLPRDVAAAAEAFARRGEARAALSLLYRGALVRFMESGVEFRQGDTEGDCLRRVELEASRSRADYFRGLVAAWQAHAYAHEEIERERLATLAREWRCHFEARPGELGQPQPEAG